MNTEDIDKNPLLRLTLEFSIENVKYCELLENGRRYVIGNQLLKSGTSIGANSFEAQNAESKADFIHKLKLAAKEADETYYWLLICKHSENYPVCDYLIEKLDSLKKLLNSIIGTSKRKENKELAH
jgi:four helix bundle protein